MTSSRRSKGLKHLILSAVLALFLHVLLVGGSGSALEPDYCQVQEKFVCQSGQCFPGYFACDGEEDCSDGSDELNCDPLCKEGMFHCNATGLCLPDSYKCDGRFDCSDNSDELGCNTTCTSSQFQCENGECVSLAYKCDGSKDCNDGSDEDHALCRTCQDGYFKCSNTARCIPGTWRCDSEDDCGDNSDEENCDADSPPIPCQFGMFNCTSGQCIPSRYICDGTPECDDGSDEFFCGVKCDSSEFFCEASNLCIPEFWKCDREIDCDQGEDEVGCEDVGCEASEFNCVDKCIPKYQQCDGIEQCDSGLDEFNCQTWQVACVDGEFQCRGFPECINAHNLCDNFSHCFDGSDELHCKPSEAANCSHDNGGCEQLCIDTEKSYYCECRPGFTLSTIDGRTCEDIDECETHSLCSQLCHNTPGSYYCSCADGYVLLGKSYCKAVGPPAYLVFADLHAIWSTTYSERSGFETQPSLLVYNQPVISGLDYNLRANKLYWGDWRRKAIMSSNLNGSDVKVFIEGGIHYPEGIAVDWVTGNIYWIDGKKKTIEVSDASGKLHRILVWTNLDKPRGLVLDPTRRLMYWSDWGINGKIERASMDGSNRVTILDSGVHWTNAIAIDIHTQTLYWADSILHTLQSSDINGENKKLAIPHGTNHAYDLVIFEDNAYWSDWASKTIRYGNKFFDDSPDQIQTVLPYPTGLKVVHPSLQPRVNNPCVVANGNCSQLCLLSGNPAATSNYTCACALGYTLQSDRRTCKEISTFIIVAHMSSILRIPLVDQQGPLFEVRLPFDQVRRATDVAWDSDNNLVFWTDWIRRSILVSDLSGNTYRQLYNDDILQPEGIAYDWLTRKIYWIDSGYGRIEVADIDGSNRRVLVSSGLQKPRGIAVHPYRGYLYWTDWGSAPKIQRMNLDGTDQRMVVDLQISGNKHQANHITVDTATNRIYWVEYNYDRIVYADLDGRGLTVLGVDQSRNHPLGVAVHGDYVYWSNTEVVKRAPKEKRDTFDVEVVTTDISMALGIDLFHRGRTMVRTPCSEDNGGCSHICVTRPHSSGRLTASCLCPTGLKMKEDGRTCANEVTKFLLVPDKFSLKMISLDVDSPVHTHIPITGSHQFDSVDYDPLEDTIYWVNSPAGQILSVPRKGGSPKVILDHLDHAENIAVDWIGRKIYFIDSGTKSIDVCNLDGTVRKRLIWEKVDAPRSLAINLRARRLYWIDWGSDSSPSRIERAYLDGSARSVLWNMSRTGNSSSSVWPRALTVDLYSEEETVYWMDSRTLAGYRLNVNHQNAEMIVDNLKAPGGISTLGGRTYYSDLYINKMKAGVVREREEDGVERVLAVRLVSPYEVKAYDKSITLNIPLLHMHPCSRFFASGCSHLCLPSSPSGPHGSRGLSRFSCACPTGIVLGPNKLTCKEVPDELIVFGDVDTLYRIPMDAQPPVEVAVHQGSGVPVDVSFTATNEPITTRVSSSSGGKDGYIFWSEHTGYIKRMWRNGSCPEINCTFFSGEGSPQGLAVDRVTGNVYFVDLFTREIKVVSYNGRFVKTIVKVGLDRPRGIALDVEKGYMFYSDWGANPQIVRTNLAGSDAVTLTTPGSTQWPNGIAIDHTNKWLYWTDAQANTIKRMKFDGSAGELVVQRVEQPFGIDFHDDHLYWSQWGDNSLYSVSLSSSSIEDRRPVRMVTNPSRIYGLAYVHQNRLTIGTTHPCVNNNGGCPFFCLMLNPTSWKCACPDDMEDQCFETYHAVDTVTDPTVTTASSTSITPTSSPTDDATVSETTPTSDTSTLSDRTVDNNSDTPSDTVTMETTGTPTTDDTPTTKEPSTDSIVTQSPEGTIFGMSAGIFSAYIIIALLSICIITVILIICFVTFQVRRQKVALKNTLKTGAPPKGPYINIAPVNNASKVEGSMEKLDVSYTNTPTTIATPSSDKRPRCTRIMSVDDLSQGSSDIGLDIISVEHNSMGQPVSRTMSLDLLRAESRDSGMMA